VGLFLRFADLPNQYVTYFVNSAYWVYLIHFFIALLLPGLINDLDLSVYLKFLIVLFVTTAICLITYHFMVRKTFIGVFLNGKKT
jgi:glucan biosynthesis protein C